MLNFPILDENELIIAITNAEYRNIRGRIEEPFLNRPGIKTTKEDKKAAIILLLENSLAELSTDCKTRSGARNRKTTARKPANE